MGPGYMKPGHRQFLKVLFCSQDSVLQPELETADLLFHVASRWLRLVESKRNGGMSGEELCVWLLAHGADWKQIDQRPAKFLTEFCWQWNHEPDYYSYKINF